MILRVPDYYKEFRCIADKCKDSCCIGWEIDIDEETFDYYKSVEGEFGQRLKEHMVSEDVNSFVLEKNGWCPFLNEKKLCDICIHLGEEALSEVCTEYPRFTLEYGDIREKALSLSCEEVGRILFHRTEKVSFEELEIADDEYEEDMEETSYRKKLEAIRDNAITILQNRENRILERVVKFLQYCAKEQGVVIQESILREQEAIFSGKEGFLRRMEIYDELEVLDFEWENTKKELKEFFELNDYERCIKDFSEANKEREYEYEQLMVYFVFRYFMKAYYDENILSKAQFATVSYLVIRDMDAVRYFKNNKKFSIEDRIDTVRIYAKEVEHSEDNLDMLEDAFSFEETFHLEALIAQLGY